MDENELREALSTATDILAHFPNRIEQKENNTDGSSALPSATSMPIIADPRSRVESMYVTLEISGVDLSSWPAYWRELSWF